MPKAEPDPLTRWRDAEAAYAQALSPFLSEAPEQLSKKVLVEMVELRGKADRWREKYFRATHPKD